MTLPEAVERDLAQQSAALERRVAGDGLYTHEPAEFKVAIAAYRILWDRVGVRHDDGSLTTDESRNIVRRVQLADGSEGVLKIIGNVREPGEGEVLAAWHAAGLPCVEPLDWGYLNVAGASVSYLLTRYADAHSKRSQLGRSLAYRIQSASRIAAFLKPFHRADIRVARVRRWEDRLWLHLHWTLPVLHERDLEPLPDWEGRLAALSAQGNCIVHGDAAGSNVLEDAHGALLLLDPPGALCALPEADVAQICAHVGGAEHAEEVVAAVCERDRSLDPDAVATLAGIFLLVKAGWALARHEEVGAAYVDVARRLLKAPP